VSDARAQYCFSPLAYLEQSGQGLSYHTTLMPGYWAISLSAEFRELDESQMKAWVPARSNKVGQRRPAAPQADGKKQAVSARSARLGFALSLWHSPFSCGAARRRCPTRFALSLFHHNL